MNRRRNLPLESRSEKADSDSAKLTTFLPKRLATKFSKKVFGWLYSFSLIILMIITAAFLIVTPLEIILQTWQTEYLGIKLLIIFGCLALFFITSVISYFSRLIQSRVQTNQIPSKSVYIPLEKGDLPRDVLKYANTRLRSCLADTKVMAGPLYNREETFNYPGMSPPEYIRARNSAMNLPPDPYSLPDECVFDDVISSIGLKLKIDGLLCGNFRFPKNYTFREIVMALAQELSREDQYDEETRRVSQLLIERYEKFRFGPDLIDRRELSEFLAAFESFVLLFVDSKGGDPLMDNISNHMNLRRVSSVFAYSGSIYENGRAPSRTSSLVNPFDNGSVRKVPLYGHTQNLAPPENRFLSRRNSSESVRRLQDLTDDEEYMPTIQ